MVPLSVHNNVPYLQDTSLRSDEAEALRSVGLHHDQGTFGFSLNGFQCDHLAAAAATREPDDDISWTVMTGHGDRSHSEDAHEADAESNDSEDWHLADDFEELDPKTLVSEYVIEGDISRCVTSCKKGPDWTTVLQIITEDVDTDEVLEDMWVDHHDDPFLLGNAFPK